MRFQTAIFIFTSLWINLTTSTGAWADQIQCWKSNQSPVGAPFMSAKVLSDQRLADIRFMQDEKWAVLNSPSELKGKPIHSIAGKPYGYVQYKDRFTLIVPDDLSGQKLAEAMRLDKLNAKQSNSYLFAQTVTGAPIPIFLACYSDF
jgi:hypothetical protein